MSGGVHFCGNYHDPSDLWGNFIFRTKMFASKVVGEKEMSLLPRLSFTRNKTTIEFIKILINYNSSIKIYSSQKLWRPIPLLGGHIVSNNAGFHVTVIVGAQSIAIYEIKKKRNEHWQLQQTYKRHNFQHYWSVDSLLTF